MDIKNIQVLIQELSKDDFNTIEEYRSELVNLGIALKDKLADTADKKYDKSEVISDLSQVLSKYINSPESIEEFKTFFRQYNDVLDSTFMKKELKELVGNSYSFLKNSNHSSMLYDGLVRSSTTLRKMKNACIQVSIMIDLVYTLQETEKEVYNLTEQLMELEGKNKDYKRQLDEIFEGYSSEDKALDVSLRYNKLKSDGLTDVQICKILDMSKPTLYKILKS